VNEVLLSTVLGFDRRKHEIQVDFARWALLIGNVAEDGRL
jgi:hypothetical protein